jgi:hypothetical protein
MTNDPILPANVLIPTVPGNGRAYNLPQNALAAAQNRMQSFGIQPAVPGAARRRSSYPSLVS